MPTGIYIRTKPPWNKGKRGEWKLSEKTKKKIRKSLLGNKRALGFIHLEETRKKNSEVELAEKNHAWKGEKVGYSALHSWVRRTLGKAKKCSVCGKEGTGREIHWANIDHKYRRNVDDFKELCANCHDKYDKDNNLRKRK